GESSRAVLEIAGAKRGGRAIHEAQLGERLRDVDVHVPAAAAEERDLEAAGAEPPGLLAHARRRVAAARRPSVTGRRPVRVEAERPVRGSRAGPAQPEDLVLSRPGIRWPHQRRDPESTGPPLLECREPAPDLVIERPLDVAGDDRVPP